MITTRLNDKFFQLWRSDVFESNKCLNYRILKDTLPIEHCRKIFIKSSTEVPTNFFQNLDVEIINSQ